ncbi:SDR family oxidoreductase [Sphingomonas sp. CCH5-D11]|uniref:SDR family oxidoreductase n=1 Tax=Sphingomonas sp. CCH5-D11 TaxID=1768786 RepID=UPI0008320F92|nr:SDR family oxidoreductase [Sphingomonas sp. CCH5-D11]
MQYLESAVTIITGAASGIGAASARRLAQAGARVVLGDVDAAGLEQLVAEIRESGGQAVHKVTDVARYEDLEALVATAEEAFGPLDILVNNAGLMLFSYWKERALADWDKMIDVNLRGYLHGIAAVLPGMMERRAGRILNLDSVAGHRAGEAGGVYAATKFFIQGMTESLRKEVGAEHADVSAQQTLNVTAFLDALCGERRLVHPFKAVTGHTVKRHANPSSFGPPALSGT